MQTDEESLKGLVDDLRVVAVVARALRLRTAENRRRAVLDGHLRQTVCAASIGHRPWHKGVGCALPRPGIDGRHGLRIRLGAAERQDEKRSEAQHP